MKDTDCRQYRFAVPLRQQLRDSNNSSTQAEALPQSFSPQAPLSQASLPQAEDGETSLLGSSAENNLPTRQGILVHLRSPDDLEGWGQAMPHSGVFTAANEAEVAEVALDAARSDLASQQAGMPLCDWLRQTSSYEPSGDAEKIPTRQIPPVSPPTANALPPGDAEKIPSKQGAQVSLEATQISPEAARISPRAIPVNALISGIAQVAEDVAKSGKLAADAGFPAVKLKVGNMELEDDIARVRALREAVGSEIAIRLDANGAWSPSEALQALHSLMPFDIEYVEEPIASVSASNDLATPQTETRQEAAEAIAVVSASNNLATPPHTSPPALSATLAVVSAPNNLAASANLAEPDHLAALADIAARSPIPVAADETISSVADLSRLPRLGIPVAVIKPAVLGSLYELFAASQLLLDEGVKVVVSSALDTSIGIACATHFAAALGLSHTPCGLATAHWLADDLAEPLKISNGQISLPSAPGLGITPEPHALERLCSLFEETALDVT